jgi:hypothetical protein
VDPGEVSDVDEILDLTPWRCSHRDRRAKNGLEALIGPLRKGGNISVPVFRIETSPYEAILLDDREHGGAKPVSGTTLGWAGMRLHRPSVP